jgi:hypothetical protein
MPMIDLNNYTQADSLLELTWFVNDITGRWFGIMLLITISVIVLINLVYYDVRSFFMFLGFFMWVISFLAFLSGLIPFLVVIIFLLLGLGSILLGFLT